MSDIARQDVITYHNTNEAMVKKKVKNKPHHISLYAGYGRKAINRKLFLEKQASKHQIGTINSFIWYCVGKVTGVDLMSQDAEVLAFRRYKR